MFQIIDQITDEYGNGKANWQLEVYDLGTGLAVPMYADYDGTIPIEDVSFIADRVVTDQFGLAQGGFVQPGTYGKRYYDAQGVLRRTIESIDMYGAVEATDAANSAAAASASATAAAGSATNAAASATASDVSADASATSAAASAASAATAEAARDAALAYGGIQTLYATWTELAALTGMAAGDTALVVSTDTGTHTDPVTAATVDNAGVYQYSASPAGWGRIANLEGQVAQAWAEGTLPGGPGTKSALEHAEDAEATAEALTDALVPLTEALSKYLPDTSGTVTEGYTYRITNTPTKGKIASATRDLVEVICAPGDKFQISASVFGTDFAGVVFADASDGYLGHALEGTGSFVTYDDEPVEAPDLPGLVKMFVSGRNDRTPDVPIVIKRWGFDDADNAITDLQSEAAASSAWIAENGDAAASVVSDVNAIKGYEMADLGTVNLGKFWNKNTGVEGSSANYRNYAEFAIGAGESIRFSGIMSGAVGAIGVVVDASGTVIDKFGEANPDNSTKTWPETDYTTPAGTAGLLVTGYTASPTIKVKTIEATADGVASANRMAASTDRASGLVVHGIGTSIPAGASLGASPYWAIAADKLGCTINNYAVGESMIRAGTGSQRAWRTITINSQPVNGNTITINGSAITWGTTIYIGVDINATAKNLADWINSRTPTYAVFAQVKDNVVTIRAVTAGSAGNSITLAKTGTAVSVSGSTLTGGKAASGAVVVGSIAGGVLTVAEVLYGTITAADAISNAIIAGGGTTVSPFGTGGTSGTGGVGTYALSTSGETVASTTIFIGADPLGWAGSNFGNILRSLAHTVGEKNELINNWAKWKTGTYALSGSPPSTLSSYADADTIRGWSYENRVLPYLEDSDALLISHGYNDSSLTGHLGEVADIPASSRDRCTFIGAMNWLIDKVQAYRDGLGLKPIPLIVEGHYSRSHRTGLVEAQEYLAKLWDATLIKAWEQTGWTAQTITTTGYWSGTTDATWTASGGSPQTITYRQMALPDDLHPFNDASGRANNVMAEAITPGLRDALFKL